MTKNRLAAIKSLLTPADWAEVESISTSTDVRQRYDVLYFLDAGRAVNLAVTIYYRRMRRHDARFQSLFTN